MLYSSLSRYWRIVRQYLLRRSVKTGVNNQYLLNLKIVAVTPVYAPAQGKLVFTVFDKYLHLTFTGVYDNTNYVSCLQAMGELRNKLIKSPKVLPIEWLEYPGINESLALFSISITR